MARTISRFRHPRTFLALATLVATSGCVALVDFNDDPYELAPDGGPGAEDAGGDATTVDDGHDAGPGLDADGPVEAAPPTAASCSGAGTGWYLDCNFGRQGVLGLPVIFADGGALDGGGEILDSPLFVAIDGDGIAYAAASFLGGDTVVYAVRPDGGVTPSVTSQIGTLLDARIFGGSPLLLLSTVIGNSYAVLLSSVENGVVTSPPYRYEPAAGELYPVQAVRLVGSTNGATRALAVDLLDSELQVVDFAADASPAVESTATVANDPVQGAGRAVTAAGTWFAVNTLTNNYVDAVPVKLPQVFYQPPSASEAQQNGCDLSAIESLADIASFGDNQIIALGVTYAPDAATPDVAAVGDAAIADAAVVDAATLMADTLLLTFEPTSGGTCTTVATLPKGGFLPTGTGNFDPEDAGCTVTLAGQVASGMAVGLMGITAAGVPDTNGLPYAALPKNTVAQLRLVDARPKALVATMTRISSAMKRDAGETDIGTTRHRRRGRLDGVELGVGGAHGHAGAESFVARSQWRCCAMAVANSSASAVLDGPTMTPVSSGAAPNMETMSRTKSPPSAPPPSVLQWRNASSTKWIGSPAFFKVAMLLAPPGTKMPS
jgi:hypothetical protein